MCQSETRYPGSGLTVEALADAVAQSEPCNDHKVTARHDQDVNQAAEGRERHQGEPAHSHRGPLESPWPLGLPIAASQAKRN